MAKELKPIDITNSPELLRLAEEIQRSQQPRVLVRDAEEMAEVRPVPAKRKRSPQGKSRRTRDSANPNDWLLRLIDLGAATSPADGPTDVSANKQKYLTDATSFVVMERLRISSAFTFDRNFAQYGFTPLQPQTQ